MDLYDYLVKYNLTNKEFARLIGVSPYTVSAYSLFKRTPSPQIAKKIAEITKNQVSIEDLRGEHGLKAKRRGRTRGKKREKII